MMSLCYDDIIMKQRELYVLVFSSFFLAFGKFIMLHVVTNLRRHAEIHTVKIGEYHYLIDCIKNRNNDN